MMMGPPVATVVEKILRRQRDTNEAHPEETVESAKGAALVIGFGRFSQMVTQLLLSQDIETTMLDGKADRIRLAAKFGFKVYYGDASRLDVLRAAGAGQARIILVCLEDPNVSLKVVDLIKANFPLAKLLVRSYDRAHSIALQERGVDYELRELLESSIVFGRVALEALGVDRETATTIEADVRHRDLERLALQRSAGLHMERTFCTRKSLDQNPWLLRCTKPKLSTRRPRKLSAATWRMMPFRSTRENQRRESRLRKSEQQDKWSLCLKASKMCTAQEKL